MKNVMRVISVLLMIVMIAMIIPILLKDIDSGLYEFINKVSDIFIENIFGIIAIALCCYCLERNDSNYFIRIIPMIMCISIFLSTIIYFFFYNDYVAYASQQLSSLFKETNKSNISPIVVFLIEFKNLLLNTHSCLALISLLFIVKPNNQISITVKRIAYIMIAANVVLTGWIFIKQKMQETLPNVYNYKGYDGKGFNFATTSATKDFANQVYQISIVCEIFSVLLLFTTNYAFSSKIQIEADEIDYEAIKKEANQFVEEKMKEQYDIHQEQEKKEIVQDNTPQEKGLMNINNQLGINSNVGVVSSKASETKIENNKELETVLPISGPVINETITEQNQRKETAQQPAVTQQPTTVQPQPTITQQPTIVQQQPVTVTQQTQDNVEMLGDETETTIQKENQNKFLN